MDRQQKIDTKTYIAGAALLLTLISTSIGVGWRLVEDRMAVEAVAVETAVALESISRDVNEMKEAFKVLAQNSTNLQVLKERVDAHDRELNKQSSRIDRLEQR